MQFLRAFKDSFRKQQTYSILQAAPLKARLSQETDEQDSSAFQHAARGEWADVVEKGAQCKSLLNEKGRTLLHVAADYAQPSVLRELLKLGIPVDRADSMGQTALHKAVQRGQQEVCQLLLQAGASPNVQDIEGNTPLHLAAALAQQKIFNLVLPLAESVLPNNYGLRPAEIAPSHLRARLQAHQKEFSQRMLARLKVGGILGQGSFGRVFLARMGEKEFALKQIQKPVASECRMYLWSEKQIMTELRSEYVLAAKCTFQTECAYYILSDYCGQQDLGMRLGRGLMSQAQLRPVAAQIAKGLAQVHARGWIYRDLKPSNVLLDKAGRVRLADFGLSKRLRGGEYTYSFCGSVSYIAPEIMSMEGYNHMVDWYMLGVLVVECLTGQTPYEDGTFPPLKSFSKELGSFVRGLTTPKVCKRLGYKGGAREVLEHQWLQGKGEELPELQRLIKEEDLTVQLQWGLITTEEWVESWEWIDGSLLCK